MRPDHPPDVPFPSLMAARHQLPAMPQPFVGREAELQKLLAHVDAAPIAIHGARAAPGIGKTALALALAHRVKAYYSDAQVYLDLQGDSPHPLSCADAMANLIQCLLPGAAPPDDLEQLTVHYRSAFAEKRALLLLDNAASAEQVRLLLPPAPCACIVTSRRALDLPGVCSIELQPLADDDARDLLLRLAPRIGPEATRLAELCAGMPLALCSAGGLLASRTDLDSGDYVRQLAKRRAAFQHLDASDLALNCNHDLMLPGNRQRWQMLCVFSSDFDDWAAATVWEMPRQAARQVLAELQARSLVRHNPTIDRYRLHDRAREVVAARIDAAARAVAQFRHAEHYAAAAAVASALWERGSDEMLKGMAFFRLEWPNLCAACAFAMHGAKDNLLAAKLCSALAEAAVNWLLLRVAPAERLHWLEPALAAARATDDADAQRTCLRGLVSSLTALGDDTRARHYEAELLSLSIEDNPGTSGETPDQRIARLESALTAAPAGGVPRARILWRLGRARAAAGDLAGTLSAWRQAVHLLTPAAT